MEKFRIDLKPFLGLAMLNQYCLTVIKNIKLVWSNIFDLEFPDLYDFYVQYYCTAWYLKKNYINLVEGFT